MELKLNFYFVSTSIDSGTGNCCLYPSFTAVHEKAIFPNHLARRIVNGKGSFFSSRPIIVT